MREGYERMESESTGEVSADMRVGRWLEKYSVFRKRKPRFQFCLCHLIPNNFGQVIYPHCIGEQIMTERFIVVSIS